MARDYGCNLPLRLPQQNMMDSTFDMFNQGKKRLLIIAPTGLGKSAVMGGIASYFGKKKPNMVTIVISHLSLLVSQSGGSFKKFWNLDTDVLQAQRKPKPDARCILSTVQSLSLIDKAYEFKQSLPAGVTVGLILIDEVHINSGVDSVDKIVDSYFPDASVVGFTGTPFKDNKDMSNLFDDVAYSVSLQEAISMNFLVPPTMNTMIIDKGDLEDVIGKVTNSIKVSHNRDKCVVFMRTIADAHTMRDMLRDAGFASEAITSKITGDDRDKILSAVRDNKPDSTQILVTVDVLSVGFDCPALKAVYMPYGTGSVAMYLQRIGRGLRTFQDKTHCDVYIGGGDPKVERGNWEKIQKKALNAGGSGEEAEIPETPEQTADRILTLETVKMARNLREKKMDELAGMIENRKFPNDLLGHLVASPTVAMFNPKAMATKGQQGFLSGRGYKHEGLSKNEASTIIDAMAKTGGWAKPDKTMPSGKFEGYELKHVPFSYINIISKKSGKYYNKELASLFGRK